ncbi:hypothetical protein [Streptomyces sp. NPDC002324]
MNRDTRRTTSPTDPLTTTLALTHELAEALRHHGITFPSLTLDLASCAVTTAARPLIELGRVNLDTARRLLAVLRGAEEE